MLSLWWSAGAGLLLLSLATLVQIGASDGDTGSVDATASEVDGQAIYLQYCAGCHGVQGEGMPDWEKPNARGELPAPPHGPEGHTWKHSDEMLFRIVHDGWRDPFNTTEHLTMPPFGKMLTDAEIKAVIDYIKMFWTEEQRTFQEEESQGAPYPSE